MRFFIHSTSDPRPFSKKPSMLSTFSEVHILFEAITRERYAHLFMGRALIYIEMKICNNTTVCITLQNIICDHHFNPNHPTVESKQYKINNNGFAGILRNTRNHSNNQSPSLWLTNDLWIIYFKIKHLHIHALTSAVAQSNHRGSYSIEE